MRGVQRGAFAALLALGLWCVFGMAWAGMPANVILLIGDGMGLEQVRAGGHYVNGREGSLSFEALPHFARVVTIPVPSRHIEKGRTAEPVTDSAAAATAMATGRKVYNSVLSVALPGNENPLTTVLERFAAAGKKTGLVTTSYLTDATPAGFAAHVPSRKMHRKIAIDYLEHSRPNVLLGGAPKDHDVPLDAASAATAGYETLVDREGLLTLVANPPEHVLGLFGTGRMGYVADCAGGSRQDCERLPSLSEMAGAALRILSRGHDGFFLMIEGGNIDTAAHDNHIERLVAEVAEFDRAVRVVLDWAAGWQDTQVLVTADHETGGLLVLEGQGKGKAPLVTWSSKGHTGVPVGLYGIGPGAEQISGHLDNTDIFRLMTGEPVRPSFNQAP